MYKMLLLDLDGTLLDSDKNIPQRNIDAINALYRDFGIVPVIATARPLEIAKFIADKGGPAFQHYIISTNGGLVTDVRTGEHLVKKSLSRESIDQMVALCEEKGLEYEFMTTSCEVADARYRDRRTLDPMYVNIGVPFNFQNDIKGYMQSIKDSIPLFAISGKKEELTENSERLSQIPGISVSKFCDRKAENGDEVYYVDIMAEGATKFTAVQALAEKLGIQKAEIIAVGDGMNDEPLFQAAGLKIAMKNANQELKEIADIVTLDDNNQGGVGQICESLHQQLLKLQQDKGSKRNDEQQKEYDSGR